RHADADGAADALAVIEGDTQFADPPTQAFGEPERLLGARAGAADQELLAAGASHEVARTGMLAQHPGDRCQDLVAGSVAMLVVDGLEMVDVDLQQDQGPAARMAEVARDRLRQPAAIEDAGQRVDAGE